MTTRKFQTALLGATLLIGGAGVALAQAGGALFDPSQLPATKGTVAQYDVTPRGDVDGLILQDGTEVHFPPHLGLQVVSVVHPGDAVTVHGLKARSIPLVDAMSITADASNKTVVDQGPGGPGGPADMHRGSGVMGGHGHPPMPPPPPSEADMAAQGTVKLVLHGPRGEVNGVMLDNGTLVHLPPPEAARLSADLQPGKTVAVKGFGVDNTLGKSIAAVAIGPAADKLTALRLPPPPPPGGPEGPGGPGHRGPMERGAHRGPGQHGPDGAVPPPPPPVDQGAPAPGALGQGMPDQGAPAPVAPAQGVTGQNVPGQATAPGAPAK